ncbi:MAG: adenosylcobinamide-GDP ribazoletransferase [Pseudomonadota bacterium]
MPAPRPVLLAAIDPAAALGLMTRLPVPVNGEKAAGRGAQAAWAWPLAGALVGFLGGAAFWAAAGLGLPPLLAAFSALTVQVFVTGALHEDGLADSADGLWGGWTRERRLEIMRDSRIGSYGVLALVLSLGIKAAALAALSPGGAVVALIVTGAASRAAMGAVMASLLPARSDGLSVKTGRPSLATLLVGVVLTLILCLLLLPLVVVAVFVAAITITTILWARVARAKIGGQTGDILGATQQLCEVAGLAALSAML